MKKSHLALMLVVGCALIVGVFGCGSKATTSATSETATTRAPTVTSTGAPTTTSTTAAPTTTTIPHLKWGSTVEVRGSGVRDTLLVTVSEPSTNWDAQVEYFGRPSEVCKVIMAKVVVENVSESIGYCTRLQFLLAATSGETYGTSDFDPAIFPDTPPLPADAIQPDDKISGFLAFIVPNDVAAESIAYGREALLVGDEPWAVWLY